MKYCYFGNDPWQKRKKKRFFHDVLHFHEKLHLPSNQKQMQFFFLFSIVIDRDLKKIIKQRGISLNFVSKLPEKCKCSMFAKFQIINNNMLLLILHIATNE